MKKLLSILIIASITACSTTPVKEQAVKIGDAQMSCQQIISENARLDESLKTINSKKGFNGTNAAAVLFFIPGMRHLT